MVCVVPNHTDLKTKGVAMYFDIVLGDQATETG